MRRPFEAPTREGLYEAIRTRDPVDPARLNPAVMRDLSVVTLTALEKDRDRRYRTALDFADDLRAIIEIRPIAARPLSVAGRLLRWSQRHPARAALVLVLAIAVPLIAGLFGYALATREDLLEAREKRRGDEVEAALEEGYAELGENDPGRALAAFQKALRLGPATLEARAGIALAHLRAARPAEALAWIDGCRAEGASSSVLEWLRADALRDCGKIAEAEELAARLDEPSGPVETIVAAARAAKRLAAVRSDDWSEVQDLASRAILGSPRARGLFYFELAAALGRANDAAHSRDLAEAIKSLWPRSARAHFAIGNALRRVDPKRAAAAYREAIRLDSGFVRAHVNLGWVLRNQADLDGAIAACRKALELQADFAPAWHHLGDALAARGDLDGALEALGQALRLEPPSAAEIQLSRGYAFLKAERFDESVAAYREVIRLQPEHRLVYDNLCYVLQRTGDFAAAAAAAREAIKLRPLNAASHKNLGISLAAGGDHHGAIAALEQAMALDPGVEGGGMLLGQELLESGDADRALVVLRAARNQSPDDPATLWILAEALSRKGLFAEALTAARQSLANGGVPVWPQPDLEKLITYCEAGATLEARLESVLRAESEPRDAGEAVELARLCRLQGKNLGAARIWTWVSETQADRFWDPRNGHGYAAAVAAALAGAGIGSDAAGLESTGKAALRRQALDFLSRDLRRWQAFLDDGTAAPAAIRRTLEAWQRDKDLAPLRDDAGTLLLSGEERRQWADFWSAVDALLARTGA
jgi:tetratricopeptide (TPR) repeat protein